MEPGGGGSANAAGGNDGAGGGTVGEGRSDLDSHVGRRRESTDSRRRVESLAQGSAGSAMHGESQPEGQGAPQQRIRRVYRSECPIPSVSSPDLTTLQRRYSNMHCLNKVFSRGFSSSYEAKGQSHET